MSVRLSPDGMYYWDGQSWVSTLSHDGRSRWNGEAWVPVGPAAFAPPARTVREPTPWTRPLQYAVGAWYVFSALYAATLPFLMAPTISQLVNDSIHRSEAQSGQPLPPGFEDTMNSIITGSMWVGVIIGIALAAVAILAAIRLWTWAYYAILVLLGLGLLGLPINVINAFSGSSLTTMQGFALPAWQAWAGVATGLVSGALFVWMLIALVRFGPWAMKRVS